MKTYNTIMTYFWLVASVVSFLIVTYNSIDQGFEKWAPYYVFSLVALVMFFMKKWMMKRMEKHLAYLKEQQEKQEPL